VTARGRSAAVPAGAAAVLLFAAGAAALEAPPARAYALRAAASVERGTATGTMRLAYRHEAGCPADTLVFLLAPNRLADRPDVPAEVLDRRYPGGFAPARLAVTAVTGPKGAPLAHAAEGARLTVTLPAPLAPGETTEVSMAFEASVPAALGLFGRLQKTLRMQGGWHPLLAAWDDPACAWRLDRLPPAARFEAEVSAPRATVVSPGAGPAAGRFLPLVAGRRYRTRAREEGSVRIEAYALPGEGGRMGRAVGVAAAAVRAFVARHGPPPQPFTIRLAHAPLASALAAGAEDLVLLDPDYGKVLRWLRPFHDRQLAYPVLLALWRRHLAARGVEPPQWLLETLGALETIAAERRALGRTPGFETFIRNFRFIPLVDEFLYTERVPGRAVYQQRFNLVEEPGDLARVSAPGLNGARVARKLAAMVPLEALDETARAYGAAPAGTDFVALLSKAAGRDLAPHLAQWTTAPRAVDYGVAEVARRRTAGPEPHETTVRLRARTPAGTPPAGLEPAASALEPVPVALSFRGGARVEVVEPRAGEATLTLRSPRRVGAVEVDPEGVTEDRWRADNREPPPWRLLLTQFGVSVDIRQGEVEAEVGGTAQRGVGRGPVLGASAFRDQESYGIQLSAAAGLGEWPRGAGHGASVGVSFERLDPSFGPVRTDVSRIVEVQAGYGVDTRRDTRFPLTGGTAGVALTWSDDAFGSEADYLLGSVEATRLFRVGPNQVIGVRAEVGQTLDGRPPFGKGLLLGGFEGLRAYPEEAFSGRSRSLGSLEYRFPLARDLDQWVAGLIGLGALTGVVGIEAGQASPDHNPFRWDGFRTGVNVGLRFAVRIFGVSPVLWSLDAGMPLDHGPQPGDTQLYISASQSF
jgi:hypothetical protein